MHGTVDLPTWHEGRGDVESVGIETGEATGVATVHHLSAYKWGEPY